MNSLADLEQYALENHVPISRKDAVEYLKNIIIDHQYQNILEVGTAIAYTSIQFALIHEKVRVHTIEKNEELYQIAQENVRNFHLENQVEVHLGDALDYHFPQTFDFIYIDASKSKNIAFLEHFFPMLQDQGMIVVDNMLLLDVKKNAKPKKFEQLEKKIQLFKEYLSTNTQYQVTYINDVGDGFALIQHS